MRRPGRFVAAVDRWDLRAGAAVATTRFPRALDRGLPLLTRAADRSGVWMGISLPMLAFGNRRVRRAAMRGLSSIALASLLANQIGKRLIPRRRPDLAAVPSARIAHRVPVSSSFPSGHSASAAAFAVAAALECPPLAAPIGALAAAVAFSRVYTGVHFPSDVLAGAALGAAVATAGAALAPARDSVPERPGREPPCPQPPRPNGEGVIAVVNPAAGRGDGHDVVAALRAALPAIRIVELDEGQDALDGLRVAAASADVLAVAGGDGTVRAAAQVAMEADVPLLVLPAGTFNHFAKDAGLHELDDALAALAAGRAVRVDVAEVDGRVFLNTASLGGYPDFVIARERWEPRLGKPIAGVIALGGGLRRWPVLQATVDGVPHRLLTIFVGNGDYRPDGLWPRWRARLDTGRLDVRLVAASGRLPLLAAAAAMLSGGRLGTSRLTQLRRPGLTVRIAGGSGRLACDGEVVDVSSVVRFAVRPRALTIYRNATTRG